MNMYYKYIFDEIISEALDPNKCITTVNIFFFIIFFEPYTKLITIHGCAIYSIVTIKLEYHNITNNLTLLIQKNNKNISKNNYIR